jgi:hypothetical protein
MALANRFKKSISSALVGINPAWPFEDRILVWLLPNLERETEAFHASGGCDMTAIFQAHQLAHFDNDLSAELTARLASLG